MFGENSPNIEGRVVWGHAGARIRASWPAHTGVVVVPRAHAAALAPRAHAVQQDQGSAADFEQRRAAARAGQAPPSVDRALRDAGCAIVA